MTTTAYNDLELMQLQCEALFLQDAGGKLLGINEPDPTSSAPQFFLARTAGGNLWRTRYDLPPELAAELERLASTEPITGDLAGLPRHADAFMALLKPYTPVTMTHAGPAYFVPPTVFPEDVVTITPENIQLVQAHFDWLPPALADYAPVVAFIDAGNAVAICFCSRLTPQVAEAGVYTEDGYRGHGYATKVAQGWAAAVHSAGRQPLYSTSWSNYASQAIAKKIGAVQYGVDYSLT